ncbi:hypothetical protein [Tepidimicrobium xylanilyticum]|uniref:hypothetical protein n=1 Tax=Tepidimicrobium xylanilyticum TaxID=1123352 RepID=UPI00264E72E5|nr:hypothetical protein [Tepidimicrobium xylanilyticum]GMG96519.1 hypothetical protein EN5CB1_13450 [Tepidimicrobium xylanilyticum]
MEYKEYLDNIERKLQSYFDIERNYNLNGYQLDLYAKYHFRNERYILSKKFVVYGYENNEHIFIKHFEEIDEKCLKEFIDFLVNSIDDVVKPDENHMSSIITGVLVAKHKPNTEIIDAIKKFKYHKGFAFGFKGWVDIRLILVTIADKYIITNRKGKEVRKVYSI